jgi:hypothetical protein
MVCGGGGWNGVGVMELRRAVRMIWKGIKKTCWATSCKIFDGCGGEKMSN